MILRMIAAILTATWALTFDLSATHASKPECTEGYEWGDVAVVEVWMVNKDGYPSRQFWIGNYTDNAFVCDQFIRMVNSTPGAPVHFCRPGTYQMCVPTAETARRFKEVLGK